MAQPTWDFYWGHIHYLNPGKIGSGNEAVASPHVDLRRTFVLSLSVNGAWEFTLWW